ncbi:hypothetical protein SEVIR_3G089050v4 [Setaria viridis]
MRDVPARHQQLLRLAPVAPDPDPAARSRASQDGPFAQLPRRPLAGAGGPNRRGRGRARAPFRRRLGRLPPCSSHPSPSSRAPPSAACGPGSSCSASAPRTTPPSPRTSASASSTSTPTAPRRSPTPSWRSSSACYAGRTCCRARHSQPRPRSPPAGSAPFSRCAAAPPPRSKNRREGICTRERTTGARLGEGCPAEICGLYFFLRIGICWSLTFLFFSLYKIG